MVDSGAAMVAALTSVAGVSHVAVVSKTGTLLGSTFPPEVHTDTLAAMVAIINAAAERLATELRTSAGATAIELGQGHLVLVSADDGGLAFCRVASRPDPVMLSLLRDAISG